MPDPEKLQSQTILPPNTYTKVDEKALKHLHAVIVDKMRVQELPRFEDGKVPHHWTQRACNKAVAKGLFRWYGGDFNRSQVCHCGRDRTWPTWSDVPLSSWMGRSGRRGRRSWYKREIIGVLKKVKS